MARFPTTEPEVVTLAQKVIAGLQAHATVYPTPPLEAEALDGLLQNFVTRQNAATEAQAAAAQATTAKLEALRALTEGIKSDLRYAENTVNDDDGKLKMLGWGSKAPRTVLEAPGQPRNFESPQRDSTSITFTWKESQEGGKAQAYCLQRRERLEGAWNTVATALTTQITLADQPRGTGFEYRVVGMNKAGESKPSNIVEAIF